MLSLEQLAGLLAPNRAAASARVKEFPIGGKNFAFNSQPAIMGVVNLSADSWYRESVCLSAESAIQRGRVLAAQGADIIDIGAESTLTHAARADAAAQKSLLLPVIQGLRAEKIPVSVETYSPAVTRACLEAGANVLNLTGTEGSDEIFQLVAAHDAAVIICYVAGKNVREVGDFDLTADPVPLLRDFFARQIEIAGGKAIAITVDLTKPGEIEAMIASGDGHVVLRQRHRGNDPAQVGVELAEMMIGRDGASSLGGGIT